MIFARLGFYRAVLRYTSEKVLNFIFRRCLGSIIAILGITFYLHLSLPRSIPILYFLLLMVLMIGSRFTLKGLLQPKNSIFKPVIIYGAG